MANLQKVVGTNLEWYHRDLAQGYPSMKLTRATASLHRQVARCLWRRAPSLPKTQRLKALRKAELHSGLARALDANPDLGMAKSLSESAIPDVVYCPFPPTRDAGERGEVE
jgi:hypothetical protein